MASTPVQRSPDVSSDAAQAASAWLDSALGRREHIAAHQSKPIAPAPPEQPRRHPLRFALYIVGLLAVAAVVVRPLANLSKPTGSRPLPRLDNGSSVASRAPTSPPRQPLAPSNVGSVGLSPSITNALATLVKLWDSGDGHPLILAYHDIATDSTSPYAVRPQQFTEQMAALSAAGAHTLTANEFAGFVAGKAVPPRSVLLTFDDGTRGVWRYADGALALYKFHAVSFVVNSFVGTNAPYYMTWDEIDALHRNGRWDIENHTSAGHRKVATDVAGTKESFVSHRMWLADQRRLETVSEFRTRVASDLDQAIADLRTRGYGSGKLFAFPFSDSGATAGDQAVVAAIHNLVTSRFVAVMNDDVKPLSSGGPFQFNRLDIQATTTTATFIDGLSQVIALNKARYATSR